MIEKCTLRESGTILDALKALSSSGEGVAFVVDETSILLGVITDGDVRRALLGGSEMGDRVEVCMTTDYQSVGPSQDRVSVLDLMQARQLRHIPIVDDSGKLQGVHLLRKMLGHSEKPNWAVVMAGGKGTRLHPLTKDIPKPMVKVAGRPILERLVLHLVSFGIRKIYLSVNYLSHIIEDHFGSGDKFGCSIEYLREEEPLGTAGSLSLLPESPVDPVLVMNGDLVMNADLEAMLEFHSQGKFHATIGVKTYSVQVPYGCVEATGGVVERIEEKPDLMRQVNAGIYVLSPDAVQSIPKTFHPITDFFNEALAGGEKIGSFDLDGDWIDIGEHDQLSQARGH